jgi:hypothetical protein
MVLRSKRQAEDARLRMLIIRRRSIARACKIIVGLKIRFAGC